MLFSANVPSIRQTSVWFPSQKEVFIMFISDTIRYVGVNDRQLDLFEGQFPVPNGITYNSYIILDQQIAVMDAVDIRFTSEWLSNIKAVLGSRSPDYLVIQHMEPDHSGSILRFTEAYPAARIIASDRAFVMLKNFFNTDFADRRIVVNDRDTLSLGSRTLTFITASMVHWPEVIMTYDTRDQVLFSADAFGKFGTFDMEDPWIDEARRYYFGIVGKYGAPVQNVLKKLAHLNIRKICPLHGPVLSENTDFYMNLYNIWSRYQAEEDGIVIAYTSVYGNTKNAVEYLAAQLRNKCRIPVTVHDLARGGMFAAVTDAFRYSKLVLATTTYNGSAFPFMLEFIEHLKERNFSHRTVAFIENGSWAPAAAHTMKKLLACSNDLRLINPSVTILSTLNEQSSAQLTTLADELSRKIPAENPCGEIAPTPAAGKTYVCSICGYVHEGQLPADFVCPFCKRGADVFTESI